MHRPGSAASAARGLHLPAAMHQQSARSHIRWPQEEDKDGVLGVNLSRQLVKVAGRVLKANITQVAPLILPLSQKLAFLSTLFQRQVGTALKLSMVLSCTALYWRHCC